MLDEQISALLDGELGAEDSARLLERIKRDPDLRAVWGRQHLLRAALRNQLTSADPAFADRLMARLQAEVAPSKVVDLTLRLRPAAVALPATAAAAPRSLRRWGVGLALAASAALAAIALSPLSPVGTEQTTMQVAAGNQAWSQVNEETARELNDYLLDHHNAAAGYGFAATSGYARLAAPSSQYVAYDPSK